MQKHVLWWDIWNHICCQGKNLSLLSAGVKTAELFVWEPGEGRYRYDAIDLNGNICWGGGSCWFVVTLSLHVFKLWDVESKCMMRLLPPHVSMVRAVSWKWNLVSRFVLTVCLQEKNTHTQIHTLVLLSLWGLS